MLFSVFSTPLMYCDLRLHMA